MKGKMRYTSGMSTPRGSGLGQAAVEAAVAIPIAVLLFCGCVQLVQIGLAHLVVLDAVYEAGRQAALDDDQTANAQRVASDICRSISPGETTFRVVPGVYSVTHRLHPLFPVVPQLAISHRCLKDVFCARGDGS